MDRLEKRHGGGNSALPLEFRIDETGGGGAFGSPAPPAPAAAPATLPLVTLPSVPVAPPSKPGPSFIRVRVKMLAVHREHVLGFHPDALTIMAPNFIPDIKTELWNAAENMTQIAAAAKARGALELEPRAPESVPEQGAAPAAAESGAAADGAASAAAAEGAASAAAAEGAASATAAAASPAAAGAAGRGGAVQRTKTMLEYVAEVLA
jgi:hypothetical protein